MFKVLKTLLFLLLTSYCIAQNVKTTYYSDRSMVKKVSKEKATYSKSVRKNEDGSKTTEVRKIENNQVVFSETYFDEEPSGVWTYHDGEKKRELDYNFKLVYGNPTCKDNIERPIGNPWDEDTVRGFTPPIFATGEPHFFNYLAANLTYLPLAKEKGIQGKVWVNFKIKKDGTLDDFVVVKGVHVLLDKEAVRVLRQMKFSAPPILKGKPINLCVTTALFFRVG